MLFQATTFSSSYSLVLYRQACMPMNDGESLGPEAWVKAFMKEHHPGACLEHQAGPCKTEAISNMNPLPAVHLQGRCTPSLIDAIHMATRTSMHHEEK